MLKKKREKVILSHIDPAGTHRCVSLPGLKAKKAYS